jgi:multiple sugar transport system permease protein
MGLLIYVNDERMYNLAFGLFKFQLTSGSSQSLMMAGAFVMTLPIIALFFMFQRYFVQGISLSGLGGR